jgi:hypothetical protein
MVIFFYSMRKKPDPINSDDATHWLIPMKAIYGKQKYHIISSFS